MEVLDIGRLIECIQERTFLWDEKNNHYRDRKARDMAWMEIGDEMFDNWSQLSRTEKSDKAKLMKDKWKHLKDSFLRSVKAGSDNIYADSLYFLRDNFEQRNFSLTQKSVSVKHKVQNDSHEANDNSSSDTFQNTNGLNTAQASLLQETSDCSSSDSIQNTSGLRNVQPNFSQGINDCSSTDSIQNTGRMRNVQPNFSQGINDCSSTDSIQNTSGLRNVQPNFSQGTNDCSSADSIQNTGRMRNVQPSLSLGISDCSSSDSIQNTNELRNVQSSLSQETNSKAEDSPEQEKAADKQFLVSLLDNYKELNEEEKLDFQTMCLQHIRDAKKKRYSQNSTYHVSSSNHPDPMQITPD